MKWFNILIQKKKKSKKQTSRDELMKEEEENEKKVMWKIRWTSRKETYYVVVTEIFGFDYPIPIHLFIHVQGLLSLCHQHEHPFNTT